jgi:hypothetical protein
VLAWKNPNRACGCSERKGFYRKGERDYRWGLCRWNGGAVFGKIKGRILLCVLFMLFLTWKWGEIHVTSCLQWPLKQIIRKDLSYTCADSQVPQVHVGGNFTPV